MHTYNKKHMLTLFYINMWLDLWKPIQIAEKLKYILLLNIKPLLLYYPETPNT